MSYCHLSLTQVQDEVIKPLCEFSGRLVSRITYHTVIMQNLVNTQMYVVAIQRQLLHSSLWSLYLRAQITTNLLHLYIVYVSAR